MKIEAKQLRAARALLGWSLEQASRACGIAVPNLSNLENEKTQPRRSTVAALVQAFEAEGVEFMDGGVRQASRTVSFFYGEQAFLELLDDIYNTLQDGDELLYMYVDESCSAPEVIERELRLRRAGIKFRSLVKDGSKNLIYPIQEYRYIPERFFINNVVVIYGRKAAIETREKITLIHDANVAVALRNSFEMLWLQGSMPNETDAKEVYV
ncbi:MAG: helix-turn-helix transcriptional regulator [Verrucomicrobiota bacterium JB022]|nr:helix-turn-helix transcriptional regulator [Verrucomicrobiota bacterium JB022]